jgi:hypothetical protein
MRAIVADPKATGNIVLVADFFAAKLASFIARLIFVAYTALDLSGAGCGAELPGPERRSAWRLKHIA